VSTTTIDPPVIDPPLAQVLEDLSDEECALWAILQDPSGLDQAEFLWHDPDSPDGCFRAWAFQWSWYRCVDPLQIDQCARSVGKSLSIKVRGFAFPFLFPGQEMVVTAPELVHLEPIVGLIEQQFQSTRLGREMLPRGRSAITHRPFQMNFNNGARIIGRIPQRDGKGVKGIHPVWLELDEAQDYPHAGWVELTETLKRGHEGAVWRAHGVTRGLRDDFYEHTQDNPDNDWTVHRFPAMYRPNWTDEERQEKIKKYGSRDDPDYRRNVLGLHGDATNPMFVLHRLMACVDPDDQSDYNAAEYFHQTIKGEFLEKNGAPIVGEMDFPARHKLYLGPDKDNPKATFWVGMDVGYTTDPSEILVWVEYNPTKTKDAPTQLKLLSRVSLVRVGHHDQVRAILWTIDFYRPKVFAMDKGGNGLPLFQDIQQQAEARPEQMAHVLKAIKGYNFSEKHIVDLDQSVEVSEYADFDETIRETGIKRNVKEYGSDVLRDLVDSKRITLPWDAELLKQYQGGTWTSAHGLQDQYGRRIYSKGNDHVLDASRFFALGWSQYGIEELLANGQPQEPVFDTFLDY
jgi:hypothetical protein